MYPKKDRLDSPKYRAWVQKKPCLIEGCNSLPETIVPHHIFGGHGRKDDKEVVPLCDNHHSYHGKESVHRLGRGKFEALHDVDMLEAAGKLYRQYKTKET